MSAMTNHNLICEAIIFFFIIELTACDSQILNQYHFIFYVSIFVKFIGLKLMHFSFPYFTKHDEFTLNPFFFKYITFSNFSHIANLVTLQFAIKC